MGKNENENENWNGPNKYGATCVLCHRTVDAGVGQYRRSGTGSGWEVRHKDAKCPGAPELMNSPGPRTGGGSELSQEDAAKLAASQGRTMTGEPRSWTCNLGSKRMPSGKRGPDTSSAPKPGCVEEHKGARYLVVQVGQAYYHSEDQCEDFDCFCGDYGWKIDYRAVPVTEIEAERTEREAAAATAKAKKEEAARVEAEAQGKLTSAQTAITAFIAQHGLVEVTGEVETTSVGVSIADGQYKEQYDGATWYETEGVLKRSYGGYDDWRGAVYARPEVAELVNAATVERMVTDPGSYLVETVLFARSGGKVGSDYSGCYGSSLYKRITADPALMERVVESYTRTQLRTDLTDDEVKYPHRVNGGLSWGEDVTLDALGIKDQVIAARVARKAKADAILAEREATRKSEEEAQRQAASPPTTRRKRARG